MIRISSRWRGTVLVCGKCSRKLDGGFGPEGRLPLAKALRRALGLGKGRKASLGVVETKCLGVCPKRAVMVVDGAHADTWLVVPAGTDMTDLAAALRPSPVTVVAINRPLDPI